jgi:hypothetical protein
MPGYGELHPKRWREVMALPNPPQCKSSQSFDDFDFFNENEEPLPSG